MKPAFLFRAFQLSVRPDVPTGSYLIACPATGQAAWVDPAVRCADAEAALEELNWQLIFILLTHTHQDHVGAVSHYANRYDVPVLAGGEENYPAASRPLPPGEEALTLGELTLTAVPTPGHTPGGTTYLTPGVAFTGDALFAGSVGGTAGHDDFTRQATALQHYVMSLPDDTLICPGHGPMTTVGAERRHNPFLAVSQR